MTTSPQADKRNDYESERERLLQENKSIDKLLAGTGFCVLCGNADPLMLEEHHIAGRKHSDKTVTVCANCHAKLSRGQRAYPRGWLDKRVSLLSCIAYTLRGLANILMALSNLLLEHDEKEREGVKSP